MIRTIIAGSRDFKDFNYLEKCCNTPCAPEEYCKNRLEYDRQTMIERYGHCDGLE